MGPSNPVGIQRRSQVERRPRPRTVEIKELLWQNSLDWLGAPHILRNGEGTDWRGLESVAGLCTLWSLPPAAHRFPAGNLGLLDI